MKISIVLLLALGATIVLRNRSAAMRHWVLAAAIACAAITPLVEAVVPAWGLPLGARASLARPERVQPPGAVRTPRSGSSNAAVTAREFAQQEPSHPLPMQTLGEVIGLMWIAGAGIGLFILLVGLGRLAWLASRARRLSRGRWPELAGEISREYGLRRPVIVLQSDHPSLLVTWGIVRPKVILPIAASTWPEDLKRTILLHELAHIRRGDWVAQMAGELLRAVYWFNPIVWVACRRLRLECERACDDAVMDRGVTAPDYAARLLDLARALNQPRTWFPAPAMARPSSLERRISAMLNHRVNRHPLSRPARVTTICALLAVTIAVAAAQTSGRVAGTVSDPQGAVLPDVKLTLSNAERATKYEVRSTRTGQFEFVGLLAGDYVLEARIPGFATFRETVTVAGQSVERALTMQIGALEETITISDGPGATGSASGPVQTATARANPPCNGPAGGATPPIGGNIRPPRKIRHVSPEYPQSLRGSRTEGVVILTGRIGLDGFIKDVSVRNQPHPDFVNATTSAVSQWQFDSTLLNCEPVEPSITVTARFVHQP